MKPSNYLKIATLAGLCALASGSTTVLAEASHKASKDTDRLHEERGTIKSVDLNDHIVVVEDRKDSSEHKFSWNDETKFTLRGKPAGAPELKPGERIRLSYKSGGDTPMIERARIAPSKAEKSTPARS